MVYKPSSECCEVKKKKNTKSDKWRFRQGGLVTGRNVFDDGRFPGPRLDGGEINTVTLTAPA